MPREAWIIKNETTTVVETANVLSFSLSNRRQSYLQTYNAGYLTLTIKNDTNQSAGFTINDKIGLRTSDGVLAASYWVMEVSYTDTKGSTGAGSTATVVCQDAFGRVGRIIMENYNIAQGLTGTQFTGLASVPGYLWNEPSLAAFSTSSTASASPTTNGSLLNYINLLINTERGMIQSAGNNLSFLGRAHINTLGVPFWSIGRTAGGTTIAYSGFERINLGLDFMNQVQVQPAGLDTQSATNAASVALYGANGFTVSTVDATEVQALGLANWLANLLADQTKQRFIVEFTDKMQSMSAAFLADIAGQTFWAGTYDFTYRVPGAGVDTVVRVILEGGEISATPSQTTFRWYLTPLTYYQFFTLDSATLGILDTSRLGW